MRSRLAILGTLALGMVLSTSGAGLAVSGFASQNDNAAADQYTPVTTVQPPPVTQQTTPNTPVAPTTPPATDDVLGEEDLNAPPAAEQDDQGTAAQPANPVQPTRQVEAGAQGGGDDEQLPFTGFAAIPILLGGVALLSTGLVLRRRSADDKG